MGTLTTAFEKISVERALGLCRADPQDSEILLTGSVEGLCAIAEPGVKSVITDGEISSVIREFLNGLSPVEIIGLSQRLDIMRPAAEFTPSPGPPLPFELVRDIREQIEIFTAIAGRPAAHVDPFLGYDSVASKIHVDGGLTANKGYSVAGITIFIGKMLKKDFEIAAHYGQTYRGKDKPGLVSRTLAPGQLAIFKGDEFDLRHKVAKGRQRGQPHRSPRIKDIALAEKRLSVAVY